MAVSSAYRKVSVLGFVGRSLMNRLNRMGEMTEPWGTPEVIGFNGEEAELTET